MTLFRRRRLRTSLSLLAMWALLWSQLVLAAHPACDAAMMLRAQAKSAAQEHCHDRSDATKTTADDHAGGALCKSHCGRSDLSSDVTRLPDLPAMPAVAWVPLLSVASLPTLGQTTFHPAPLGAWHRPTRHPASVLLI
ncbi:hypothetical protein [Ahniella affigens]|nr:hypothetical protein [Ahniella affigens]